MTEAGRQAHGGPGRPPRWTELCPYLFDASARWRASHPTAEHRCTAVRPALPLRLGKQLRLCLLPEHVECPTYVAARGLRTAARGGIGEAATFTATRTAPVVLERPGRIAIAVERLRTSLPQVAVAFVILLAAAALILARLVGP